MKKILVGIVAFVVAFAFVCGSVDAAKKTVKKAVKKHHTVKKAPPPPEPTPPPEPVVEMPVEKPKKHKVKASDFPEKGWHKGPYLAANIGMMQATNDKHVITDKKFDGTFDIAFGLTFGWDIADWIGPMLQINYATSTGTAGDSANTTADGGGALPYNFTDGSTYPADTFPSQNARAHSMNVGLYAKATLPYFTRASWQGKNVKFLPYFKLGGLGTANYVNAATAANKVGTVGGGPSFGLGAEFFIWKGFFFAIDATESIVFNKAFYKNISYDDANGVRQTANQKITKGGTSGQFQLLGLFGWHF